MKKKVFFIMSTDDYSGAEAVNFDIIENLKHKYDFYWVSKKGNINKKLKENKIKWIEISKLSRKEIKRVIKQYKPDILHATDYKASVITALTLTKTPIISHLHNNSPWIKKPCLKSFALLFSIIRAKKVLAVSNSIKNEYIFARITRNKIETISNPVDYRKIERKYKKFRKREKLYDICCVARVTEQKNPLLFIEVIKRIKSKNNNIKAIWVGDGDQFEECQKIIEEQKLAGNLSFIGHKDNPYIYYGQSKVFLLTSSYEGYGLAAFEALSMGLPCIVSNVGGLKDIVDDECGEKCTKIGEYADACIKYINNISHYEKVAINRAKKLSNAKSYMDNLNHIYTNICEGI